ncbi:MAG: transcriptional regulator NrdR [Planctomycetaceae bacterium]
MRCPFCRTDNDRVIDSRSIDDGANIRRRRECLACRRRFTTYERVERQLLSVVKKGGVREPFDREKIRSGLAIACGKRPVTDQTIEGIVSAVEQECHDAFETEVPSRMIGERVMELLRGVDQVAYVRFASVYREFKDARDFVHEVEPILADGALLRAGEPPARHAEPGAGETVSRVVAEAPDRVAASSRD